MKKFISLADHGNTNRDSLDIQKKIRENLIKEFFDFQDFQTLQFEALRQINEVRRFVKNQPDSIIRAIDKVISHFNFPKTVINKLNTQNQFVPVNLKMKRLMLTYLIIGYLDLIQLPIRNCSI